MASIPANVILIWTGTNATIPSGWTRETTLDGKYPKAWSASVAPNNTGGSNTHTHTGNHTHTLTSHTHTASLASLSQDRTGRYDAAYWGVLANHTHSVTSSVTTDGGLQSATVTWSSVNQEPPYYTVIFIKPSSTAAGIQSGICAHYYGASVPTGWYYCDGTNSTPDLRNKYLKGAVAGGNSGTTGGGTSHSHTVTHTHTVTAHSHTGTSSYPSPDRGIHNDFDTLDIPQGDHTHSVSFANTTDTINSYTKTDAGSGNTVEVAYKKLGVIKNSTGGPKVGMIGLWLGATASIPNNWKLCDGTDGTYDMRDKFVKIGASLANNNETGGANTHTHTSVSHTHTATGTHTHTASSGAGNIATRRTNGSDGGTVHYQHTHTVNTISSTTATYSSNSISADTVSNQPAYTTVAYIQLDKIVGGGAFLYNLI